jgi:hypothetical protein
MMVDAEAASKNLWKFFSSSRSGDLSEIEAFGKNEYAKNVFWTLFMVAAALVLARVVNLVTAQQRVGVIRAIGV